MDARIKSGHDGIGGKREGRDNPPPSIPLRHCRARPGNPSRKRGADRVDARIKSGHDGWGRAGFSWSKLPQLPASAFSQ